jgi:hypothetical protein
VDLGCGFYKPAGFIGVDNLIGAHSQIADQGNLPDILMNLDDGAVPLPDQSCIEIRTSHFLEHSNLPHIFDEVFRLLKPNGLFVNLVPYANSAEGMYPGHNIFLTEKWFEKNMHFQRLFSIEKTEYYESEDYQALPAAIKELLPFPLARKFLFNACWQMRLVCRTRRSLPEGVTAPAGGSMTGVRELTAEQAELTLLRGRLAAITVERDVLLAERAGLRDQLDAILASSSWHVTAPLRALKGAVMARR